ncbi:unnamed protein product, partial [Hapterophycus canaliculatus]
QNEATSDGSVVEDICSLKHLHEAAILDTLRRRFWRKLPYTYAGGICIAMNPFETLNIYGESARQEYKAALERAELPPHLYATSAQALNKIKTFGSNQSIVVTGESGAGKTHTVKLLIDHLMGVTEPRVGCPSTTKEEVLASMVLLESFGNAKTPRNKSSSRFGASTSLKTDRGCRVSSVEIEVFLLEDGRVVSHGRGERNFHVFHQV